MSSDAIHSIHRQYIQVVNHCLKARLAKTFSTISFLGALAPGLASAQSVQDNVVDANPVAAPLEKTIGYYTSTSLPSVAVGSGGIGMYLYISSGDLSGPWSQSVIDPNGDFYERARPFQNPDDAFPNIVASRSGQLVLYQNPLNSGGDPTQPWPMFVIANNWCHDIRVVDLDGDGKPDIICSATFFQGTSPLIAYQNSSTSWQIINNPFTDPSGNSTGDSVNLISVANSSRTNVLGATVNGVYWFQNPGSRTGRWVPHLIDNGGNRNDIGETALGVVPYGGASDAVIVASREEPNGPWPNGLAVLFSADGRKWTPQRLDTTYRAVHEGNGGDELGPFFIVDEQEQVAPSCNSQGLNEHPVNIPACRVTLFQYQASAFVPTLELSSLGTHNQAYVLMAMG